MKERLRLRLFLLLAGVLASVSYLDAQTFRLLRDSESKYLMAETSGDAAYEHIRFTTQYHKPGGSEGVMSVARYVEDKAREFGLEDVRLIKQQTDTAGWNARRGELWLVQPDIQLLASIAQVQLHLADNSGNADVTAEVIEVGDGSDDKDYEGKDVRGRIVLTTGNLDTVTKAAVEKRGAVGIIWYPPVTASSMNNPDQLRWIRIPADIPNPHSGTFAFGLSLRQGVALGSLLKSAKEPVRVHAVVESAVDPEKWQVMVEGFIRGAEINGQDVLVSAHIDEEKFSANDNGSGVANTLEIARAMAKLIREGHLPRPRRNIRFWWTTEMKSERQYFADHPEDVKKLWVDVNQDMVGANQAQGTMRLQVISRLPFSRCHFFNDVAEAIVDFVVHSNTRYIPATQTGVRFDLYPRPILAHMGTLHRYNAIMVPFAGATDHLTFNEAPIGIPGITFTDWPDEYIHSSDDDLWNIDRTQLQRNAFAAGAIAYVMARVGDPELPVIAKEVYGRATVRLAEDFKVACALLSDANASDERLEAYKQARNQLRQALVRELRNFESLADVGTSAQKYIQVMKAGLAKLDEIYTTNLDTLFWVSEGPPAGKQGRPQAISVPLSTTEQELTRFVPQVVAGPLDFLVKRDKTPTPADLHRFMAMEVLNFVDGKRTGLDIYNAVSAEALRAGGTYYGLVTPDHVLTYLRNLEKDGILRWNPVPKNPGTAEKKTRAGT